MSREREERRQKNKEINSSKNSIKKEAGSLLRKSSEISK